MVQFRSLKIKLLNCYKLFFRFGNGKQSAIIILINLDKKTNPNKLLPYCQIISSSGHQKYIKAEITPIHDSKTSDCRLLNYRFACHSFDLINSNEIPKFILTFKEKKNENSIQVKFCIQRDILSLEFFNTYFLLKKFYYILSMEIPKIVF